MLFFTHRPQALCYERRKNCASTFNIVFPTKIDVVSMFARQTTLALSIFFIFLGSSEVHDLLPPPRPSRQFPRTIVPNTSVFYDSDDVCGFFVTVDFAAHTRTQKNPATLLGALSPVCASCGVIFGVPPPHRVTHRSLQESSGSIWRAARPTVQQDDREKLKHRDVLYPQP